MYKVKMKDLGKHKKTIEKTFPYKPSRYDLYDMTRGILISDDIKFSDGQIVVDFGSCIRVLGHFEVEEVA